MSEQCFNRTFEDGWKGFICKFSWIKSANVWGKTQFKHHLNFRKGLKSVCRVEVHRGVCKPLRFGWPVHHTDADREVVLTGAILALHKDVLWSSQPQQIGGRHHLPTEQNRTGGKAQLKVLSGQTGPKYRSVTSYRRQIIYFFVSQHLFGSIKVSVYPACPKTFPRFSICDL